MIQPTLTGLVPEADSETKIKTQEIYDGTPFNQHI